MLGLSGFHLRRPRVINEVAIFGAATLDRSSLIGRRFTLCQLIRPPESFSQVRCPTTKSDWPRAWSIYLARYLLLGFATRGVLGERI